LCWSNLAAKKFEYSWSTAFLFYGALAGLLTQL